MRRITSVLVIAGALMVGCTAHPVGQAGTSTATPGMPPLSKSQQLQSTTVRTATALPVGDVSSTGTPTPPAAIPVPTQQPRTAPPTGPSPAATSSGKSAVAAQAATAGSLNPPPPVPKPHPPVDQPNRQAAQLPGGGRTLFPGHLLVALYGQPGVAGLGALGEQSTTASIDRVRSIAARYAPLSSTPVLPTFEIIATVADSAAGTDGDFSAETTAADLQPMVDAATAAGLYVVLDLQPGRTDFLTQAHRYAQLLRRPNVGLALDPEWRLGPTQRHLEQIGSVDASEINTVSQWLAALTSHAGLPQKLLLIHQFQLGMIRHEATLNTAHRELALVVQMDGQGSPGAKDETWQAITAAAPAGIQFGWKNFFTRDSPTISPADTMSKRPTPTLVSYE